MPGQRKQPVIVQHAPDCDLDLDCTCGAPVCPYCAGSGEAYDPQTGEGPVCPACDGTGSDRVGEEKTDG
jgi:hypothetical protein